MLPGKSKQVVLFAWFANSELRYLRRYASLLGESVVLQGHSFHSSAPKTGIEPEVNAAIVETSGTVIGASLDL